MGSTPPAGLLQEEQGLLWVFPSSGAQAAAAAPLPVFPENEDPVWSMGGDYSEWLYQDTPWSFDIAQENPMVCLDSGLGTRPTCMARCVSAGAPGLQLRCVLCAPLVAGPQPRALPPLRLPWHSPPSAWSTPTPAALSPSTPSTPRRWSRGTSFFKLVLKKPALPLKLFFRSEGHTRGTRGTGRGPGQPRLLCVRNG